MSGHEYRHSVIPPASSSSACPRGTHIGLRAPGCQQMHVCAFTMRLHCVLMTKHRMVLHLALQAAPQLGGCMAGPPQPHKHEDARLPLKDLPRANSTHKHHTHTRHVLGYPRSLRGFCHQTLSNSCVGVGRKRLGVPWSAVRWFVQLMPMPACARHRACAPKAGQPLSHGPRPRPALMRTAPDVLVATATSVPGTDGTYVKSLRPLALQSDTAKPALLATHGRCNPARRLHCIGLV